MSVSTVTSVRLALGPLLYYWPRATTEAFYDEIAATAVDIVYLGEVVCGKRHELKLADLVDVGRRLAAAGKEVVLSTLALPESETDLRALRRIVANGEFAIEANDMGAVRLAAAARVPFVIGPHVNAYHPATLDFLRRCGATRWVSPVELSQRSRAEALRGLRAALPLEVFAYGRVPLAFSARCFTARACGVPKDDCRFRCQDDPEGIVVSTVDEVPVLVLNGIQTQSVRPFSLAPLLGEVVDGAIDVLRISPQQSHTAHVLATFRACLDGCMTPDAAQKSIERTTGSPSTSGYWSGRPGIATDLKLHA